MESKLGQSADKVVTSQSWKTKRDLMFLFKMTSAPNVQQQFYFYPVYWHDGGVSSACSVWTHRQVNRLLAHLSLQWTDRNHTWYEEQGRITDVCVCFSWISDVQYESRVHSPIFQLRQASQSRGNDVGWTITWRDSWKPLTFQAKMFSQQCEAI